MWCLVLFGTFHKYKSRIDMVRLGQLLTVSVVIVLKKVSLQYLLCFDVLNLIWISRLVCHFIYYGLERFFKVFVCF